MTVVVDNATPAGVVGQTHLFVIGIDSYPWLNGGATARGPNITDGMGQLSSPAKSARDLVDWFLTQFKNPARPLGSINMLLSQDGNQSYTDPDGVFHAIDVATIGNIETAAEEWKARGDANQDDLLIFFFSGHGISAGARYALLARNYGESLARPLKGAISFTDFVDGMKSCKANHQMFFVDACRVASGVLLTDNTTETGNILVAKSLPLTKLMNQSVYFASLADAPAYGRANLPTLFTEGLLFSLRGPGASDATGEWWINTTRLQEAMNHFVDGLANPDYPRAQTPASGVLTTFDFHSLGADAVVPLYLLPDFEYEDSPPSEIAQVTISTEGNLVVDWVPPGAGNPGCEWKINRFRSWISAGKPHVVDVHFGPAECKQFNTIVSPPYRVIKVAR
jgi:hypothetical protein